ncbi:hypothetical protein GA565_11935 [Rouxiella sp. S1S-2]|nr:hypothetical protein GA565_11935 [Rouxiella sp. S1S-2]
MSQLWPKRERVIANVIGVTPEDIWPGRYLKKVRKERESSKK